MAEAIILPIVKSILGKIASFTGDVVISSVSEEIKAAKSAKKDLKKIADELTAIRAVLQDAEKKQYTNEAIKVWLRDLKHAVYDIDDLLDEVAFDALQRRLHKAQLSRKFRYFFSSSNPFIFSLHLGHKIRDLREQLEYIVAKKDNYGLTERLVEYSAVDIRDPFDGSAFVKESSVIGRDEAKQDIIKRLTAVTDVSELTVLPIVGMGGIGKTALAKLVHKDVQHFDLKLWVCVSDKFRIPKIIEDILKDGTGDTTPNQDMSILVKKLHNLLSGKKYLLVLDDVWVDDYAMWLGLKNFLAVGKAGSVMLITARNPEVASITRTIESYILDRLPESVSLSIFEQLAFAKGEEDKYSKLHDIGRSIVTKCCGIPLVVKTLASMLRNERDEREWQRINNMDSFTELHEQYDKVVQLLRLSYDKLPSHLKPCFAYMSLYTKDSEVLSVFVSYMWSALGVLPLGNQSKDMIGRGYDCFMELASKSLFDEISDSRIDGIFSECKMHDLLHDLAVNILGEELAVVTLDKMTDLEFARHVVWGYEELGSLKDKEFPIELVNAKKARTFRFGYVMNQQVSHSFLEGIISNLSCLRILDLGSLWFEELPKTIGNLKHLRCLDLSYNPILKSLPNTICNLLNLETFRIHGCSQLKELPRDVHKLQSLKQLTMTTCQESLIGTKFIELTCLEFLSFNSCERLISLWDNANVGLLTSLRHLYITDCPKLTSLPNSIKFLVGLTILNCQEIDLEKGEGLQGLESLRYFIVKNMKMASLPKGIRSAAASLQCFGIMNCGGLVELPDWFHCFTSLREIEIKKCPNMLGLPNSFGQLTSLQELCIDECPHLSKRCAVPDGEDYSLIRNVPKFKLDGVLYTPNQSH